MKIYTVKEVAEMLSTDPETIRRWIRAGKIKPEKNSNKEGYIITEQVLQEFLRTSPKYASAAAIFGIGAVLLGGTVITNHQQKRKVADNTRISQNEIVNLLAESIMTSQEVIEKRLAVIKQLEKEIEVEKLKIVRYQQLLQEQSLPLEDEK